MDPITLLLLAGLGFVAYKAYSAPKARGPGPVGTVTKTKVQTQVAAPKPQPVARPGAGTPTLNNPTAGAAQAALALAAGRAPQNDQLAAAGVGAGAAVGVEALKSGLPALIKFGASDSPGTSDVINGASSNPDLSGNSALADWGDPGASVDAYGTGTDPSASIAYDPAAYDPSNFPPVLDDTVDPGVFDQGVALDTGDYVDTGW